MPQPLLNISSSSNRGHKMPVYKDSNGTWYYTFKNRDPVTGKWLTKKKRGFSTKREAQSAERDALTETKTTTKATFLQIAHEWEDSTQAKKALRQKHSEHFKYRFGEYKDKPLDTFSKPILSRWRSDLAKNDKYSTRTKNLTISYVNGVFKYAHGIYDTPDYSAVLKSLKLTDEERTAEKDVWTPQEFETFLAAVDHPLMKIFYSFLFWTGCRRGEAVALQKADVGDHEVTIRYSQRDQKNGLKPTKTKTVRTVKIDDDLWEQMQPLMKIEGPYVFGGETGIGVTTIRKHFLRGIEKSGVKPINLHDLRHSHGTWLINNGVNVVAVSRRLGHKDITTTLNIYTHLLESTDNQMMEKINSYKNSSKILPNTKKDP